MTKTGAATSHGQNANSPLAPNQNNGTSFPISCATCCHEASPQPKSTSSQTFSHISKAWRLLILPSLEHSLRKTVRAIERSFSVTASHAAVNKGQRSVDEVSSDSIAFLHSPSANRTYGWTKSESRGRWSAVRFMKILAACQYAWALHIRDLEQSSSLEFHRRISKTALRA